MPSGGAWRTAQYRANRTLILAGGPACVMCGKPATTADHIIPRSQGGGHELSNLRPACVSCNASIRADSCAHHVRRYFMGNTPFS